MIRQLALELFAATGWSGSTAPTEEQINVYVSLIEKHLHAMTADNLRDELGIIHQMRVTPSDVVVARTKEGMRMADMKKARAALMRQLGCKEVIFLHEDMALESIKTGPEEVESA